MRGPRGARRGAGARNRWRRRRHRGAAAPGCAERGGGRRGWTRPFGIRASGMLRRPSSAGRPRPAPDEHAARARAAPPAPQPRAQLVERRVPPEPLGQRGQIQSDVPLARHAAGQHVQALVVRERRENDPARRRSPRFRPRPADATAGHRLRLRPCSRRRVGSVPATSGVSEYRRNLSDAGRLGLSSRLVPVHAVNRVDVDVVPPIPVADPGHGDDGAPRQGAEIRQEGRLDRQVEMSAEVGSRDAPDVQRLDLRPADACSGGYTVMDAAEMSGARHRSWRRLFEKRGEGVVARCREVRNAVVAGRRRPKLEDQGSNPSE